MKDYNAWLKKLLPKMCQQTIDVHSFMQVAGMPIGVQVVGRHWQERQVLAIMKILESHFKNLPDYPIGNVLEIGL